MKKVMMLVAVLLGTIATVNAQPARAKTAPAKEVKSTTHAKKAKTVEASGVTPAKAAHAKK